MKIKDLRLALSATPKKVNNHDENLNKIRHQFNWGYVANANKAICAYMGNDMPKRLYSNEQLGYFMPSNEVIYIIMPYRL